MALPVLLQLLLLVVCQTASVKLQHRRGQTWWCCICRESTSEEACVLQVASVSIRTKSASEDTGILRLVAPDIWYGCGVDTDMGDCVLQGGYLPVTSYGFVLLLLLA
jgi:hypothetical protein